MWLMMVMALCFSADPCYAIEAKAGDGEVTISWIRPNKNEDGTPLTDLAGYYIYRSEAASDIFVRLNEEPLRGICFTDSGLVNGITYFYAVTAVDYTGNESKKSPIVSTTPNILPPSKVRAKPGDSEVRVLWEPYDRTPLKGYHVYRRIPMEQTFSRLTDIPIQDAYFVDTQVANGLAYFYTVCCVGMDGIEGLRSPEYGATPMPVLPDELSSVHARFIREPSGDHYVVLTWEPSEEDGIAGYRVYRRLLREREFTSLTPEPVTETEYTDRSVMPDQGYLYSVVAVTEKGMESQYPREAQCFTSGVYIASFSHDAGEKAKKAGDRICLCLMGEPGMRASFLIEGFSGPASMEETDGGVYTACLDVTGDMAIEGAFVTGTLEDPKGNSTSSTAAEKLTIDTIPPNKVVSAKAEWADGYVTIAWVPPEGEIAGFEITRQEEIAPPVSEIAAESTPLASVSGDATSYIDARVKQDRTYHYILCSLDRAGNRSEPLLLPPVYIPAQTGIPFIEAVSESTGGMPQKTGDRIEVELVGEDGCQGGFIIPGIIDASVPLIEQDRGRYTGSYIVRPEDQSEQTLIRVCLQDDLGHVNCQNAASGLIINCDLQDTTPPAIHELLHNAFEIAGFSGDLVPGNTLEITMQAEAGCTAFAALLPQDIDPEGDKEAYVTQKMHEDQERPGTYAGAIGIEWDHPSIEQASVWACVSDRAGNRTWKQAEEPVSLDTRPRIRVIPEQNALWADQESQARISVTITDANGEPVAGHLVAITLSTTDEYTGVVGGGGFDRMFEANADIDFDLITDSWGEVEETYTAGFAAKTAVVLAKDLTTGHAGAGYILTMIKAQTDIELLPQPSLMRILEASPYKLILTAEPDRLTADGVSTSWITAQLADRDNQPVSQSGVRVSFFMEGNNGGFSSTQASTDSLGQASIRYTAGTIRGTVFITAVSDAEYPFGGLSGQVRITLMSDAPAIMELAAEPARLVADGYNQSEIRVWVADINRNAVQQAMVAFSILQRDRGDLSALTQATDFNGWAECTYTTPALSGQSTSIATILATVTSKAPTEEELARATGTIFIPLLYPEMDDRDEVKIIEWLSRKGDKVQEGTPLVRLETEKGELVINAPVSGELAVITIHRGERAYLGQGIGQILSDEEYWDAE